MVSKVLFSSKKEDWGTPDWLFKYLNRVFSFTLDAAASDENHLCKKYFTKENDSLKQSWKGEIVFLNPPYSRNMGEWIKKGSENDSVILVPSRTDTNWFHEYCCTNRCYRLFIKGRLKFKGAGNSAPFPSLLLFFNDMKKAFEQVEEDVERDINYNLKRG